MSDPNITAYPLAGYCTMTVRGRGVLLEMKLIARHPQQGEIEQSLPFQMTAQQATELGQSLIDAATASKMGHAPSTTRN